MMALELVSLQSVGALLALLVLYSVYSYHTARVRFLRKTPWVGRPKGVFRALRACLKSFYNMRALAEEAYQKVRSLSSAISSFH
jgi:hypothetical protein